MSLASCGEKLIKFLERTTGRLTFEDVERTFSRALDGNPVFADLEKKAGFSKNIVVVLGGRGCGKTLTIRYIKYRFGKGWDFERVDGVELSKDSSLEKLRQIVGDKVDKLETDRDYKVVIAVDDVAEVGGASLGYLKDEVVDLVRRYAGRVVLVLATQSERIKGQTNVTLQILKESLARAPSAELFIGERPEVVIESVFKNSYIKRNPVVLLRGASLINLDAYWSSLRRLDKVKELADVIVKIAEFYIKNLNEGCDELLERVSRVRHGLALVALSSLPKLADPDTRAVIEYKGIVLGMESDQSALNGLGMAELLRAFLAEPHVESLVEKAERLYGELSKVRVRSLDVDEVKRALIESCDLIPYVKTSENVPISSLGIQIQREAGAKRGRYGPRVDLLEVERAGQKEFVVMHYLKTDKKGYVTHGTVNKLKDLVELGVPMRAESRYLIVLVPETKGPMKYLYRALGVKELGRLGRDVLPLLIGKLTDVEKSFVHLLNTKTFDNDKVPDDVLNLMRKVFLGTVLLSLRDHDDIPQLIYRLLPYVSGS